MRKIWPDQFGRAILERKRGNPMLKTSSVTFFVTLAITPISADLGKVFSSYPPGRQLPGVPSKPMKRDEHCRRCLVPLKATPAS
jgi:hypothetical protein